MFETVKKTEKMDSFNEMAEESVEKAVVELSNHLLNFNETDQNFIVNKLRSNIFNHRSEMIKSLEGQLERLRESLIPLTVIKD